MSNGTEKRTVSRRLRRATLVGLGVLVVTPALAHGQTSDLPGPIPGEAIQLGKDAPASVKKALKANKPVVISFLLPNSPRTRSGDPVSPRSEAFEGANTTFSPSASRPSDLGDLPDSLGVRSTPTVVVVSATTSFQHVARPDQEMIARSTTRVRRSTRCRTGPHRPDDRQQPPSQR